MDDVWSELTREITDWRNAQVEKGTPYPLLILFGISFLLLAGLLLLYRSFYRWELTKNTETRPSRQTVAQLAIAIAMVGIVVSTLNATGMPTKFAVLLSDAASSSLMAALLIAAAGCIVLGMGMPTLPAYVNVILIIGPLLVALGTSLFTAHMFIFYFAVASAITPPQRAGSPPASTSCG